MNESIRDVLRSQLVESGPRDAKRVAKWIAQQMSGTVAGSISGFGTEVTGIAKNKANRLIQVLKADGYEDVTNKPVYRQLVMHLQPKAWVFAKDDITVRVADVDKFFDPALQAERKVRHLLVHVLFG